MLKKITEPMMYLKLSFILIQLYDRESFENWLFFFLIHKLIYNLYSERNLPLTG